VESPSLEIFQTRLDKVLCSLLWVTLLGQGVGLGDPQRALPTPTNMWFCDSVLEPEQGKVGLVCKHRRDREGQRLECSVNTEGSTWGLVRQPKAAAGRPVGPGSIEQLARIFADVGS